MQPQPPQPGWNDPSSQPGSGVPASGQPYPGPAYPGQDPTQVFPSQGYPSQEPTQVFGGPGYGVQQQPYGAPGYDPQGYGTQGYGAPGFNPMQPQKPKRTGLIIGCVIGALALIAGLALTVVLLTGGDDDKDNKADDKKSSKSSDIPGPSSEESESKLPSSEDGTGVRGDVPPSIASLGVQIQSNLSSKNVDGLLLTVCEAGKANDVAKNDLIATIPPLDPANPDHDSIVQFNQTGGTAKGDGYALTYKGTYGDNKEIVVEFSANLDDKKGDGKANWCGVSEAS